MKRRSVQGLGVIVFTSAMVWFVPGIDDGVESVFQLLVLLDQVILNKRKLD